MSLLLALLLASTPPFIDPNPGWTRVGSYRNHGVYWTALEARMISEKWDPLFKSKVIIFQINLVGKHVGAMEFDVRCRDKKFLFEQKIPTPDTGARYFSKGAEPHFEKAKIVAKDLYCKQLDSVRMEASL